MSQSTYARSYPWAVNPVKLIEAITDLENAKKLDPSVVINEDTIKARYIVRKGLVKGAVTQPVPADGGVGGINTGASTPEAPAKPRVRTSSNVKPKKAAAPAA